jgi:hypothetical protein
VSGKNGPLVWYHDRAGAAVVPGLEVVEDRVGKLYAGAPASTVQELDLHAGPERTDHGVVVAVDY